MHRSLFTGAEFSARYILNVYLFTLWARGSGILTNQVNCLIIQLLRFAFNITKYVQDIVLKILNIKWQTLRNIVHVPFHKNVGHVKLFGARTV